MQMIVHEAGVVLFWTCLGILVYSYAGYPLLLSVIAPVLKKVSGAHQSRGDRKSPRVSLIIAAFNEERIIEQKVLNALALHYPRELLEIIVISDGSTDRTDEIVAQYADRGVVLKRSHERLGKSACLNQAVPEACGEIVILTDANALFEENAVMHLTKRFLDQRVGFVTGYTKYTAPGGCDHEASVNLYTRLETLKKERESDIGSCVGADGAILALRKELYPVLTASDINDFVIPLYIVKAGYRGLFERNAFCFEEAQDGRGEFRRQIRITSRTLRAIIKFRGLMNPGKFGLFSLSLVSNKVLRFLSSWMIVPLYFLNLALYIETHDPFYGSVLLLQTVVYGAGLAAPLIDRIPIIAKIGSISRAFLFTNAAIMVGCYQFWKGESYITWRPIR